jgi:L-2,4-diaminobutyrate decarboxylase
MNADSSKPRSSKPLDNDHKVDRALLQAAIDLLDHARRPRSQPVPAEVDLSLPSKLIAEGLGEHEALARLAPSVLEQTAQLHHPGYFAHMDPPTPSITWAAALWQVASNQNLLHPDAAPSARQLERRVVEWIVPYFGMQGGHFVPGATISNFTALWAAREVAGVTRVICSDRAHLSVKKSADILGLRYEAVASDDAHQLPIESLKDCSDAAVVLTAGTVGVGAIDPLRQLSHAGWVHVDAAWAGPLRFTTHYASLLDGIEFADSVGFSAHKWLYQPKGAALVLFKDLEPAHRAMTYGGGYLAAPNVGILGSAPAAALPLAATLLAWGQSGLRQRIERDLGKAQQLAGLVNADRRFELWGPGVTGVVVWRPRHQDARSVRQSLTDAWVSLIDIDGEVWFRSVAVNSSADPEHVFDRVAAAL